MVVAAAPAPLTALESTPPDLFNKCRKYTTAREVMAAGVYPYFQVVESEQSPEVMVQGRKMIMLGSNNYLGLTNHPEVKEAAIEAVRKYGSGCAGSRLLNGTLDIHVQLEEKLASFFGKEAALTFSTGYQTNLGIIACLAGKNDVIVIDKLDHASIIDACRLSFAEVKKFKHHDLESLEYALRESGNRGKLVIVDGVYSMEGDIAPLPDIVKVCRKYGARLMVDDAHGIGVLGKTGRGTVEHFGLEQEVDIIMGSFSKSLASIGGFVAGAEYIIHYLKHNARPLMFTAALPASNTAGVLAALEVLQSEPERRAALWENARRMASGLKSLGFDIGPSQTPIIPVLIGPLEKTLVVWRKLFDAGVFTNPVAPPAVPPSQCRLRTSVMATHTAEQIDFALGAFAKIAKAAGVI